jgi:hypothetical protein
MICYQVSLLKFATQALLDFNVECVQVNIKDGRGNNLTALMSHRCEHHSHLKLGHCTT